MNRTTPSSPALPGFTVIPKRRLAARFRPTQAACYVLLGRRGRPETPRESVMLVQFEDDFLRSCQQQIEELWRKHRVPVTHVAVKLGRPLRRSHDFAEAYARAVTLTHLREQLHPRFRRL